MKTRSQSKREIQQMEVDKGPFRRATIFEIPPILENIFKHLDGKAVIQASAVNMEWNKLCTESQQVEKLKLVVKPEYDHDEEKSLRKTREAVKMLRNSKRKYQSIEWHRTSTPAAGLFLPLLAERAGSWKFVKFQDCTIDHQTTLKMLRIIEPSVEELFIPDYRESRQINDDLIWNFPSLKNLEVRAVGSNILQHFVHCTTLVKFHWLSSGVHQTTDPRTILRNNHNLEELDLRTDATLLDNPSEFRFKLKKLQACFNLGRAPQILQNFLETQTQTLESLEVAGAELNQASLELILSMPRLSSLKTSVCNITKAIESWNRAFPVNTTITSLELNFGDYRTTKFEAFMRALHDLKNFKCYIIKNDVLPFLARAAPALESLETNWFNVTRFPEGEVFPNLTKFKVGWFHHKSQEPTGDSHFATLVLQEMIKNPERY